MTELGIAAWALSATLASALAWMIVKRRERTKVLAGAAVGVAAIVGLLVVIFAGLGAFCVPPPGAACM